MAGPDQSDGTVGKALAVLDDVASVNRPVRFAELLSKSPLPKATLYRLLRTLTNQGMLTFDPVDHTYRMGLRLVRLAHVAWSQSSLAPIARPWLDALSARTGETVHLAQLDNGQVLYVDKRSALNPIDMFSQAGRIGPAYCTGVGKAMLAWLGDAELDQAMARQAFHRFTPNTLTDPASLRAELPRIRAEGVSFDREEHEPGIICVATPILSQRNRPLGALSVTSSTQRHKLDDLVRLAPDLRETAEAIAHAAESWRFPETIRNENSKGDHVCPV